MAKVPSGTEVLDELLGGGYETGVVTTVYGPSSTGKTNLCLLAAVSAAKTGKVIFIDTEGGSSEVRLQQLSGGDKNIPERIFFLRPTNYSEQVDVFNRLKDLVNEKISMVVVDTISMLYRVELGNKEEVYHANKTLGKQLSYLVEIARKRSIPVVIANQVYSNFDDRDNNKMVGGDIVTYSSKCLIELKKKGDVRVAVLKKHRSMPEKEIPFEITAKGIIKAKKNIFGF